MGAFNYFIYFTFFIKLVFLISTLSLKYLEHKNKNKPATPRMVNLSFWKERSEFIFKACLSVILIWLFNPRSKTEPVLNTETKLLLYLYGFIVILQSNWEQFFKESPLNRKSQTSPTQISPSQQSQSSYISQPSHTL